MEFRDIALLLHPLLAVVVVYPLIGIVLQRAMQTRQRRLQTAKGGKSKLPPTTGLEHVQIGRWLAGSVVGIVLLAFFHDIYGHIIDKNVWEREPFKVVLITLTFGVAISSLALLYKFQARTQRIIFGIFTIGSLIVLGSQSGVYHNDEKWYISHYYYGLAAAILMVISVAILLEIYQDRTNRWRKAHIALNSIAVLIFLMQGFTGTLSLLEIPLAWQKPYIQKLYERQCDRQPCSIQTAPPIADPDRINK
jgi:MFS family permease